MMKLRLLVFSCVVIGVGIWAATAASDPTVGPPICSGGPVTPITGTFGNLVITGNRYVPSGRTLTTWGTLTVAPGACLDAFTMGTVHVGSSLVVSRNAILALGCTLASTFPPTPCTGTTNDTVGGNIYADHPLTMYLDGDTIGGNITSIGGGPGPTFNPYINFPIKDNVIYGSVNVSGWQGAWFGFIRNITHGSVTVNRTVGVTIGDLGTLDSTEIATNVIGGDLICSGNSPAAQIGDSGGTLNVVGGRKIGECAAL